MAQHMLKDVLAISAQGRLQGLGKIGHGDVPLLQKTSVRPEGYSNLSDLV